MISVVVLTHNDAGRVEKTLQSLTWCDDLIVIDDYSTDNTVEIVRKYTKRVFAHQLADDFAAQRNYGLRKATGEWVLFVDSDEIVNDDLRQEISGVVGDGSQSGYSGYFLKRKDWLFGQWLAHGETASVRLLRLARKNAGIWVRPVHEVWEITGQTSMLISPLEHFPHANLREFLSEINRYTSLDARHLYKNRMKTNVWEIVGFPVAKFVYNYFGLLGFFDGTAGAIVAVCMSLSSFLKRAKLYLLWEKHPGGN